MGYSLTKKIKKNGTLKHNSKFYRKEMLNKCKYFRNYFCFKSFRLFLQKKLLFNHDARTNY